MHIFFFMCDMLPHYIITRPCRFWSMRAATIMLIKSAFLVPQKARSPPSHTTPFFFQLFSHTSRQLNLHIVAFFSGDKILINARVHGSGPLTTANLLLRFSVKEAWVAPAVPSSAGRTTPMHRYAPSCTSPIQPFHHFSLLIFFLRVAPLDDKKRHWKPAGVWPFSPFLSTSQAFVGGKRKRSGFWTLFFSFSFFLQTGSQAGSVNMLAQVESA